MPPNVITMLAPRRSTLFKPTTAMEPVVPAGRIKRWAASHMWRLLKHWGAAVPYGEKVEVVHYTHLATKPLLDAILEAIDAVHDAGRQPRRVIMGAEDFRRLSDSPEVLQVMEFQAGPFHRGTQVFGVEVRVVPWIEGWAVL